MVGSSVVVVALSVVVVDLGVVVVSSSVVVVGFSAVIVVLSVVVVLTIEVVVLIVVAGVNDFADIFLSKIFLIVATNGFERVSCIFGISMNVSRNMIFLCRCL